MNKASTEVAWADFEIVVLRAHLLTTAGGVGIDPAGILLLQNICQIVIVWRVIPSVKQLDHGCSSRCPKNIWKRGSMRTDYNRRAVEQFDLLKDGPRHVGDELDVEFSKHRYQF